MNLKHFLNSRDHLVFIIHKFMLNLFQLFPAQFNLVKLIENYMIEVVNFLLNSSTNTNDFNVSIDFMDDSTGKTPLLAALKVKQFELAKKLLKMGAKPMIPSTLKYPSRSINHFIDEIRNFESDESKDLLNYVSKLFN
jgi:ankyrin repeat protein